jgi:PAS domain S-box-containing protein
MQTMLVFNHISYSQTIGNLGYTCFLLFIPFFLIVILEYIRRSKQSEKDHKIRIQEIEKFIDDAALISKANEKGKITYVNKKFTEVSGYTLDDVIGKDHSIVNSGYHPSEMWSDMYNVVIKEKGIWNKIVTNKGKSGNLYYVDTYIKAEFDSKTNKKQFRLGGFLTKIEKDYIVLSNGSLSWSVQKKTSVFYQKMSLQERAW